MTNPKPTLLVFSHVSNKNSITGAEKVLLFFCIQMTEFFECTLVVPNDGKLSKKAREQGITVIILPISLAHGVYTPSLDLPQVIDHLKHNDEYESLKKLIRSQSPDLIITNTCVHILPAMAAKELGIPIIWKVTEVITDNAYTSISIDLINQYSDWIIAISDSVSSCFPQELRQSKMSILPPSWSEELLHPEVWPQLRNQKRKKLKLSTEHRLVGYISSFINQEKGLDHFIDMAINVAAKFPKSRFLVIGSPIDESYLRNCLRKIKEAGIRDRFTFIPFEDSVQSAYCAMDMVVIPSLIREGFGMTALEGLVLGKPVVAYASGGLSEILQMAGCEDYLAPPGDKESLSSKVCQLLESTDGGASVGAHGQERVHIAYGLETYRERLKSMVIDWLKKRSGWFPLLQAPEGHLLRLENGELQTVTVDNVNQIRVRQLPGEIISQIPQTSIPTVHISQEMLIPISNVSTEEILSEPEKPIRVRRHKKGEERSKSSRKRKHRSHHRRKHHRRKIRVTKIRLKKIRIKKLVRRRHTSKVKRAKLRKSRHSRSRASRSRR